MNAWRYTDLKCMECGGIIVQDIFKLEYYCLECGLIHLQDVPLYDLGDKETISPAYQTPTDEWREENEYARK